MADTPSLADALCAERRLCDALHDPLSLSPKPREQSPRVVRHQAGPLIEGLAARKEGRDIRLALLARLEQVLWRMQTWPPRRVHVQSIKAARMTCAANSPTGSVIPRYGE